MTAVRVIMDGVYSFGIRGPRRGFIRCLVQLMHSVIAFGAGGVFRFLLLVDAIGAGWRTILLLRA
jgi:hypothetical protein